MTLILIFADGQRKAQFDSTFDAFCEVLNAFNQCEEYFIEARLATTKRPINILEAEAYLGQVGPVKDYLERAAAEGISDEEICETISQMFFTRFEKPLASWKRHMREYVKFI